MVLEGLLWFFAGLVDEGEGGVTQRGEGLRGLAFARGASVFAHQRVLRTMQLILDAPVMAVEREQLFGRGLRFWQRGDERHDLGGGRARALVGAGAGDAADLHQPRPNDTYFGRVHHFKLTRFDAIALRVDGGCRALFFLAPAYP